LQLVLKDIDLKTCWIKSGKKSFIYFETIDTTLNIALDQQFQESSVGKIVITDNQTSGKGSYNKSWYSESYKDLTFSIILGSSNNFQQNLIDETCSVIVSVLNEYQIEAYQKLPNDIYVRDKKIAGVLLSNVQTGNSGNYQALSVGININSNIELKKLDSNAKANHTSFAKELGKEINREKVLVEIIELLDKVIQKQVNQ
jgi:BirA family biotin operon repressor/biotin-[acetyl-CoA-carboxylase] ligase